MSEPLRMFNEPLTFQDQCYIQIGVALVRTAKENGKRTISCDIQAAWDLAKAMASWREKMSKENE